MNVDEQGIISKAFGYLFGRSWRTTLWGIMALLPQIAKPIQDYLIAIKVPERILDLVTMIFAILFIINSKDRQVAGSSLDDKPDDPGKI